MAAASVNLRLVIERIGKTVDKAVFSHSALFVVPSLATTFASYGLFTLLRGNTSSELNTISAILMSSVILSLLGTAGIQFIIYQVVGEASVAEDQIAAKNAVRNIIIMGVAFSIIFSIALSGIAYPYLKYVLSISTLQFLYFAILLILYSIIWVQTAAFWASERYVYPALIFAFAYSAAFALSYLLYHLNHEYIICGFIGGVAILLALSSLVSWSSFIKGQQRHEKLRETLSTLPKLISRHYWGILFQVFFIIALFLDKIIVWVSQGEKAGSGLLIVGPYTTAAFLGLVPTLSIATLAYFAEKVKPLSKKMYSGTLADIQRRINEYKGYYGRGLLTMLVVGLILLIIVVGVSAYFTNYVKAPNIVITIAAGALCFQVILYDSFVLPAFGKSYISTVSLIVVCLAEALTILFVSSDIWYVAMGFLGGSFVGCLISHFSTRRLLAKFEYNAFRAFYPSK